MVYVDEELEYEVINEFTYLFPKPPPYSIIFPPEKKLLQSKKKHQKNIDNFKQKQDSFNVVFANTNHIVYLINELSSVSFKNGNFLALDSICTFSDTLTVSYRSLAKEKINDSTKFPKPCKIEFIYNDKELIKPLFDNDNFGGLISFSRILFNKEKTKAVFTLDRLCGSLCGGGFIIVAKKINGKWETIKHIGTWIS